jgi:hypothetical protein
VVDFLQQDLAFPQGRGDLGRALCHAALEIGIQNAQLREQVFTFRVGPLAFGDVDDGAQDEMSFGCLQWIQADLDRDLAAVLAQAVQFAATALARAFGTAKILRGSWDGASDNVPGSAIQSVSQQLGAG